MGKNVFTMKKTCTKCKSEKHEDEFARNTKSSDGKASWCKACLVKANKKYKRGEWIKMVIG